MKNKRKLIAFDIDGTLLTSQHCLLDSTKDVIRQLRKAGHFVIVATGRSYPAAEELLTETKFENYVLCNGAYAFVNHELMYTNPINKEELHQLINLANEKKVDIIYQTMDEVKQQERFFHATTQEIQDSYLALHTKKGFDLAQDTIYQAVVFSSREQEHLFQHRFNHIRFTRWSDEAMDAVPMNGSKAVTLAHIAAQQSIELEDMIVFGDGENDIEMLRLAGTGVAMGNASSLVQRAADYVTASNDNHGIYKAVQQLELL